MAPLAGLAQSSFRAETLAILHVVPRAAVPVRIMCDCKGVVELFKKLINDDANDISRLPDSDLWVDIRRALPPDPLRYLDIVWMPSHLEESKNLVKRVKALDEGITLADVDGNVAADELAKKGAEQIALPKHIAEEYSERAFIAKAAHHMMVTIWHRREDAERGLAHVDPTYAAEVDHIWEDLQP